MPRAPRAIRSERETMPVTNQIPFPQVAPGSSVDVSVAAPPAGVLIHSDGEHRFQGQTIDQAGHPELCPGPRSFPLNGAGTHSIDIRVFNLMSTSTDATVTIALRDPSGNAVAGPFPVRRTIPPNDSLSVTILALVSEAAAPARTPRNVGKKTAKKTGKKKGP